MSSPLRILTRLKDRIVRLWRQGKMWRYELGGLQHVNQGSYAHILIWGRIAGYVIMKAGRCVCSFNKVRDLACLNSVADEKCQPGVLNFDCESTLHQLVFFLPAIIEFYKRHIPSLHPHIFQNLLQINSDGPLSRLRGAEVAFSPLQAFHSPISPHYRHKRRQHSPQGSSMLVTSLDSVPFHLSYRCLVVA
jgi:hypothetical protein